MVGSGRLLESTVKVVREVCQLLQSRRSHEHASPRIVLLHCRPKHLSKDRQSDFRMSGRPQPTNATAGCDVDMEGSRGTSLKSMVQRFWPGHNSSAATSSRSQSRNLDGLRTTRMSRTVG
jgi:hypothetical protein